MVGGSHRHAVEIHCIKGRNNRVIAPTRCPRFDKDQSVNKSGTKSRHTRNNRYSAIVICQQQSLTIVSLKYRGFSHAATNSLFCISTITKPYRVSASFDDIYRGRAPASPSHHQILLPASLPCIPGLLPRSQLVLVTTIRFNLIRYCRIAVIRAKHKQPDERHKVILTG